MLFRNVGNILASDAVSYPRRRQSFTFDVIRCNFDLSNLLLSELTDYRRLKGSSSTTLPASMFNLRLESYPKNLLSVINIIHFAA